MFILLLLISIDVLVKLGLFIFFVYLRKGNRKLFRFFYIMPNFFKIPPKVFQGFKNIAVSLCNFISRAVRQLFTYAYAHNSLNIFSIHCHIVIAVFLFSISNLL